MQNEFVTVTEEKPALVFPGSSDWGEAWINDIWYEFLTSDLAYVKTPLNEVSFSICR